MTYRAITSLVLIVLSMAVNSNVYAFSSTAKIIIQVVDEDGQPIEGANVGVGFRTSKNYQTQINGQQGSTDGNGRFSASGSCNGHVSYGADKEGYYNSRYAYDFKKAGVFGWEPHNPELTVVLRKIGKKVPMFARNTVFSTIELPVANKNVGFDLIKFDWVAPYGSGEKSDFIFHLKRRFADWDDQNSTLKINFENKYDGIQVVEEELQYGSIFKLPRSAPKSGYKNDLEFYINAGKNGYRTNVKQNENYIFRIRSKDENGKLIQAIYGKILGPIDYSLIGSETAKLYFKYYLNPDGTRNLEFDPNRNLFGKLPRRERVGIK